MRTLTVILATVYYPACRHFVLSASERIHFPDEETVAEEAESLAPAAWLWLGSGVCAPEPGGF